MTGSSRRSAAALALVAALATGGCGAGHAAGNGDAPVRYSDTPSLAPDIPARQSPTPTPTSTENPSPTGVPTR